MFNHFADECPDKDMPAICGKCAGRHKTKDCNRNSLEKCVNDVQIRERNFKHNVFSCECNAMVMVKASDIRKTDLDGERNE